MSTKTYSKEEFTAMVAELESEFLGMMKSEQAAQSVLAKSEDEAKEDKKEENEPAKEDSEEKKDEPKAEETSEETKEEPKAEDQDADENNHGYDEEDLEEMHKMYASMSKGELQAHKEAIEKCGEISIEPKEEVAEMAKSEGNDLLKTELEKSQKENEELKKNIEGLVSAINSYVTNKAPVRKAITDIEFVKKSEESEEQKPLTKSEINAILAKKVQDPTLTKSDRDAINQFYLTNAGVEKISHLLKK